MNSDTSQTAPALLERAIGFRDLAKGIRENIISGEVDSLDAMIALKMIKKSIETVEKDTEVSASVMQHFDRYNEKTVELRGASVTIKDAGIKYDFTLCNDQQLNQLMAEKAELDAKIKERQEFLKKLPDAGLDVFNTETGEVYTIFKPLRLASQTLEYKFKK